MLFSAAHALSTISPIDSATPLTFETATFAFG